MPFEIHGPQASIYKSAILQLRNGEITEGWKHTTSSINARVLYNSKLKIYYKEFLSRNAFEIVKAMVRGSRCYRARKQGELLTVAGFNTPTCVCWGKLASGSEFMITEASTATGVTQYIRQHLNLNKSPRGLATKRKLLRKLGQTIGKLHQYGIVHGDLRTSNILTNRCDEEFLFCLIDNERNSRHRIIPLKLVKKNLVQLNMLLPTDITRGDRWRFFSSYIGSYERFSERSAKQLAIEVYQIAMGRLSKKGKL